MLVGCHLLLLSLLPLFKLLRPSINMFGAVAVLLLCSAFSEAVSLPTVDLGYAIQQATLNVSPKFIGMCYELIKISPPDRTSTFRTFDTHNPQ